MVKDKVEECNDPPCLHVVFDIRRKRFAVFFEDSEGTVIYLPAKKVMRAYNMVEELEAKHFKEASGYEIDELARKYLGAEAEEESYE